MFVNVKGSLMDTLKEMQQDYKAQFHMPVERVESLRTVDYVIVEKLYFNGDRD